MTEEEPKSFGKRGAPPVITHRPGAGAEQSGHQGVHWPHVVISALIALILYEVFGLAHKSKCEPDPSDPEEMICEDRNGSYSSRGGGGDHSSVTFGGFGHYGYHSGGG